MSDARASQNTERLPWIANENDSGATKPLARHAPNSARGHGGALRRGALLVLALAYWIAMHNWEEPDSAERPRSFPRRQPPSFANPRTRFPRTLARHISRARLPDVAASYRRPTVQRPVPLARPSSRSSEVVRSSDRGREGTTAPQRTRLLNHRSGGCELQPTTDSLRELSPAPMIAAPAAAARQQRLRCRRLPMRCADRRPS